MEVSRGVEAIRGFLAPSSGVCSSFGFVAVLARFFFHLGSSGYQLSFQAVFCCWLQEVAKWGDFVAYGLGSNFPHPGIDNAYHDDNGASYL